MSRELQKVLLAANLVVLGGALAATPAPASDRAPSPSVNKQVSAYEVLTTGQLTVTDRDPGLPDQCN
jgi:hypothetical protein